MYMYLQEILIRMMKTVLVEGTRIVISGDRNYGAILHASSGVSVSGE